jgi:phosphoesterase RecJ-like protein
MGKKITIADLAPVFEEHQRFALCSHTRPDGDAIGSVLALKVVLEALGKEVVALNEDGVPENLQFLKGSERVERPDRGPLDAQVFIALDTANRARLGEQCLALGAKVPLWVNIDHHISNEEYGDLILVDDGAAAVGEIVYRIITELGLPMPEEARDALYVAVSTDTGSFQYANTGAGTHEMAADLVRRGLSVGEINARIYHDYPFRRVELLTELLGTLERSEDGRLAWWMLTNEVKDRLEMQAGDTEGLVDIMRAISGVVMCVFFEEMTGAVRVSMRSKDARANVCRVCALFGGGGHVMASGARVEGRVGDVTGPVLEAAAAELRDAGI